MNLYKKALKSGYCTTILIVFVAACLLAGGCDQLGQKDRVYRVGMLSGLDYFIDTAAGFKNKMSELGYIEGENIVYDSQNTNFEPEKEQQIIEQFITNKVDLILTFPTEVSLLAKNLTKRTDIPVVFANANIEGIDLVDSVREPGGNLTGVRYPGPDLAIKRFEILREIVPQAKRILVPYQREYPNVGPQLSMLRKAAVSSGVTLLEVPASNAEELQADFQARAQSADIGIDAMLFIAEPLAVTPWGVAIIGAFAIKHNIPFGGAIVSDSKNKSIFDISTQNFSVGEQAAVLADKILRGVSAGTIPVVSAESYFIIDYKSARDNFNLNISNGLLSQANEILR